MADWANAYLDLRYPESLSQKQIIGKIKKLIGNFEMEILTAGLPFHTDKNNPYIAKYCQIAKRILKRAMIFDRHPAASDARFFSEKKIPTILTEPPGGDAHSRNEWVDIRGLEKLYQILEKFIM